MKTLQYALHKDDVLAQHLLGWTLRSQQYREAASVIAMSKGTLRTIELESKELNQLFREPQFIKLLSHRNAESLRHGLFYELLNSCYRGKVSSLVEGQLSQLVDLGISLEKLSFMARPLSSSNMSNLQFLSANKFLDAKTFDLDGLALSWITAFCGQRYHSYRGSDEYSDRAREVVSIYTWMGRIPTERFLLPTTASNQRKFYYLLLKEAPTWLKYAPNTFLGVIHYIDPKMVVNYSLLTPEQLAKAATYLSHLRGCSEEALFSMLPHLTRVAPNVMSVLMSRYTAHDIMNNLNVAK